MKRILIVDDDAANRMMLSELFRRSGYDVSVARHGAEALESAQADPPDLVFSDLLMPIMDGYELCRRLKADSRLRMAPFVVYSATYTDPRDARFAKDVGAARFLEKPQPVEKLLEAVREELEAACAPDRPNDAPLWASDPSEVLARHNEVLSRKLETKVRDLEDEIARRDRAESALRESERRFRLLADNAADVIWTLDADARVTYVSPSVCALRGVTPEEALTESLGSCCTPSSADALRQSLAPLLAELRSGGRVSLRASCEIELRRKNGTTVWAEVSAGIMRDESGAAIGIQGVTRDISRRKFAEEERLRLQQLLLRADRLESVGRLAGGIAHDFNNILAIILSYAGFAKSALPEGSQVRDDIEEIRRAGERAANLTRQLLAFAARQPLTPKVVDLNQILRNMESMLRRLLGETLRIEVRTDPELGRTIAEPGQLEQVILNLAVNARDAMPNGGTLTLETSNVLLEGERARRHLGVSPGPYVALAVTDTGHGMDAHTLAHVFEPFFTTKEVGRGTGLGLSIAYGIIKQSGGAIWAYSEPDRGSTFKVYLPHVDADARCEPPSGAMAASVRGKTILVVEDEPMVLKLSERILEKAGYRVRTAASSTEALAVIEEVDGKVDLLLTDVVTPSMNGKEVIERITERCPGLKTLFMSGYPNDDAAPSDLRPSTAPHIDKPFTASDLTRRVREVLDGRTETATSPT